MLSAGRPPSQTLGHALAARAEIAFDLQDYSTLERRARESLDLSQDTEDKAPVPVVLRVIGQAAMRKGQFDEAMANVDKARLAAESANDDWELGLALVAKAAIAVRQRDLASAQQTYEDALTVLTDNHRWGVAQVQYGMGTLAGSAATLIWRSGVTAELWKSFMSLTPGRRSRAVMPVSAGRPSRAANSAWLTKAWPRDCG